MVLCYTFYTIFRLLLLNFYTVYTIILFYTVKLRIQISDLNEMTSYRSNENETILLFSLITSHFTRWMISMLALFFYAEILETLSRFLVPFEVSSETRLKQNNL